MRSFMQQQQNTTNGGLAAEQDTTTETLTFLEQVKQQAMATTMNGTTTTNDSNNQGDHNVNKVLPSSSSSMTRLEAIKQNAMLRSQTTSTSSHSNAPNSQSPPEDDDENATESQLRNTTDTAAATTTDRAPTTTTTMAEDQFVPQAELVVHADTTDRGDNRPKSKSTTTIAATTLPLAFPDEQASRKMWYYRIGGVALVIICFAVALAVGLALGLARNSSNGPVPPEDTMQSNFSRSANLNLFRQVVNRSNLWDFLHQESETNGGATGYTILAPIDDALRNVRKVEIYLNRDQNYTLHLQELLKSHIFKGSFFLSDIRDKNNHTIQMLSGGTLQVTTSPTEQSSTMGNVTVAPVFLGSGNIVDPDLVPDSGIAVVHGIDALLDAPLLSQDPFQVSAANYITTVVEWINLSGFKSLLSDAADFTVFLPTDTAMAQMPAATRDRILYNSTTLVQFLLGHSLPNVTYSDMFQNGKSYLTVSGDRLQVYRYDNGTQVVSRRNSQARLIKTNLLPYSGVMHIIDNYLLPSSFLDA